jgi:hypothetical protein
MATRSPGSHVLLLWFFDQWSTQVLRYWSRRTSRLLVLSVFMPVIFLSVSPDNKFTIFCQYLIQGILKNHTRWSATRNCLCKCSLWLPCLLLDEISYCTFLKVIKISFPEEFLLNFQRMHLLFLKFKSLKSHKLLWTVGYLILCF